jgi:hypothetical protein
VTRYTTTVLDIVSCLRYISYNLTFRLQAFGSQYTDRYFYDSGYGCDLTLDILNIGLLH